MKKIYIFQVIQDGLMTLLLLLLMGFHLHGDIIHEWAGMFFMLLIALHLFLNRHRLWSLPPARPRGMVLINRTMNLITAAVVLVAIVSGMMLSRHIFADLPIHNPAFWVRKVHMTAVHWGMLILAIHIGLHWKKLATFFCRVMHTTNGSPLAAIIMPAIFTVIAVLGLYEIQRQDYLAYLLMNVDFSFFDYDESAVVFYLRYFSIIILFALTTRFLLWWFIFRLARTGP